MSNRDDAAGYGRPPRTGRFQKGTSGNPAGRPRGSRRTPPHEDVLGEIVQIKTEGETRHLPVHEAFPLRLADLALKGNSSAQRALEEIDEERALSRQREEARGLEIVPVFVDPGSVTTALEPLKMARRLNPFNKDKVRVVIEPWLVEATLARLGNRRLSREDQATVLAATRTPRRVNWPAWWDVLPD